MSDTPNELLIDARGAWYLEAREESFQSLDAECRKGNLPSEWDHTEELRIIAESDKNKLREKDQRIAALDAERDTLKAELAKALAVITPDDEYRLGYADAEKDCAEELAEARGELTRIRAGVEAVDALSHIGHDRGSVAEGNTKAADAGGEAS